MTTISVQIQRYVDDNFPGWVECSLVDALGEVHLFIQKVPIVSSDNLSSNSAFPQVGAVGCEVEAEMTDERGRNLLRVSTAQPWSIESTVGVSCFLLLSSQVVRP